MGLDAATKVRENRLRRMADRQGLALVRSRRRDPLALDYGLYWLHRGDEVVTAPDGLPMDAIEQWLTNPPSTPPPTG